MRQDNADGSSLAHVRVGKDCVQVDECRKPFRACLWHSAASHQGVLTANPQRTGGDHRDPLTSAGAVSLPRSAAKAYRVAPASAPCMDGHAFASTMRRCACSLTSNVSMIVSAAFRCIAVPPGPRGD